MATASPAGLSLTGADSSDFQLCSYRILPHQNGHNISSRIQGKLRVGYLRFPWIAIDHAHNRNSQQATQTRAYALSGGAGHFPCNLKRTFCNGAEGVKASSIPKPHQSSHAVDLQHQRLVRISMAMPPLITPVEHATSQQAISPVCQHQ